MCNLNSIIHQNAKHEYKQVKHIIVLLMKYFLDSLKRQKLYKYYILQRYTTLLALLTCANTSSSSIPGYYCPVYYNVALYVYALFIVVMSTILPSTIPRFPVVFWHSTRTNFHRNSVL